MTFERLSPLLTGAALAVYCLAARGAMPLNEPTRQTIDVIEHSTVYSYCGNVTLKQWVFHDRGEIRAWRLDKGERVYRDFDRGGYWMLWQDGEVFREIRALSYEETHLQHDPEVTARETLPQCKRRPLLNER